MSKILKATHEGEIEIGNTILNCAVLEDGTRVLTLSAVFKAFDRPVRSKVKTGNRVIQMPSFLDANNLQPFVDQELIEVINEIEYLNKKGSVLSGYDAKVLPMICDVYLKARREDKLTKKQLPQAIASEVLLTGLSRIGIIALVDEATGYQYDREKKELQKILKQYISEELLPWSKRFPDEFYTEIFRLNGWDYTVGGIKKRPGVIGTWTKQLIYYKLPRGVLQELIKKTPKSKKGNYTARLHQSLTDDVGNPHLDKQLVSVITLMNISKDWDEFLKFFKKKFGQQTLEFDQKIESKPKEVKESRLSSFNQTLERILQVPNSNRR